MRSSLVVKATSSATRRAGRSLHLMVVGDVVIGKVAASAVFEPFLAGLVAADVEGSARPQAHSESREAFSHHPKGATVG